MPNTRKTFPTLTKAERVTFDLHLASMTKVERPDLADLLLGGLNDAPIVLDSGKVGSAAWRNLHASDATVYIDESTRKRQAGGSQVETVRAFVKRIASAYADAFREPFPALDAIKLTDGEATDTVDIWRIR